MATKMVKGRKAVRLTESSMTGTFEGGSAFSDITAIRRGYSWGSAVQIQKRLALNDPEFADIIGVSNRTLTRQRRSSRPLDKIASDRLYRLKRVLTLATLVMENEDSGLNWLRRPQPGLGGAVPVEILDTEPGFEAVETLLQRVEHGVVA